MPDRDILEISALLGLPHSVGEAQVGVADHSKDVGDSPVDHRVYEDIADGALPLGLWWQCDIDPVFPHFGSETGRGVVESLRRLTGERVVVISVPRAPEPTVFDRPFTQRPALMRTVIVESAVVPLVMAERQPSPPYGDRLYPSLG